MKKKHCGWKLGIVLVLTLMVTPVSTAREARLRRISIGTNPVGTVYFVVGGGIAKLFSEKLGIPSRAVPYAGSSVYLPLLDKGEITLGLNTSLDSALAYRGGKPYLRKLNVRALARVFVMPYAYFVRASSGIERFEDLKGRRIVVDVKGNASLAALNWAILATAGLGREDVIPIAVGGIEQGVDAVTESRADAAPIGMGIPLLLKAHTGIPGGVRVMALGRRGTDELMGALAPGSRTLLVSPSPEYVGISEPTLVSAFDTFVNVGTGVSAEDAYLLAKTLHENWESLQKDYPALSGVSPDELAPSTNPHPYSEGAVLYFKNAGVWTAANDAQQAKVSR